MIHTLLCALAVSLGGLVVTRLYITFISHLGTSFPAAANAYWAMIAVSFLAGFLAAARPPLRTPPFLPTAVLTAVAGTLIFRAAPEGFLLFGVTGWANSWAPPMLGAALGAAVGAESTDRSRPPARGTRKRRRK